MSVGCVCIHTPIDCKNVSRGEGRVKTTLGAGGLPRLFNLLGCDITVKVKTGELTVRVHLSKDEVQFDTSWLNIDGSQKSSNLVT